MTALLNIPAIALRTLLFAVLCAAVWTGPLHAAQGRIFHNSSSILDLTPNEARQRAHAQLHGVVTEVGQGGLFLQDASAGIWIFCANPFRMRQGDEIVVDGRVGPGTYSPVIRAASVRIVGRARLPKAKRVSFAQLSSGDMDSQLVSVQGWIRVGGTRQSSPDRFWLKMQVEGGFLFVSLPMAQAERAKKLVGSYVRLTAVASSTKNEDRQITSPTLVASNLNTVTVLQPAPTNLFSGPAMPIAKIFQYRSGTSLDKRIKVQGTVTYQTPGQGLIIEDRGHALSISSMQSDGLRLGERIDAVGFPSLTPSGPELDDTLFRSIGPGRPVQPSAVTADQLSQGSYNNMLVRLKGKLVRLVQEPAKTILLIQSGSAIVLAELATSDTAQAFKTLQDGTKVQLTGICDLDVQGTWNLGPVSSRTISYKLLLRGPQDVTVLGAPSWWTARRLVYLSLALSMILLALIGFGIYGRIRHWRLKMVMAERERFSHELHDTLAQGFAGLGFQLQAIRRAVPAGMPGLRAQVDMASNLARYSHQQARGSFEPTLPSVDENRELLSMLEATARQLTEGGLVSVSAERTGIPVRMPAKVQEAMLRTGQEAIANAVRHANPTRIDLLLEFLDDSARLSVRDDGCGFVKSGDLLGFGLHGMRRRAAAVEGKIEINTRPGGGTTVSLTTPVPRRIHFVRCALNFVVSAGRRQNAFTR